IKASSIGIARQYHATERVAPAHPVLADRACSRSHGTPASDSPMRAPAIRLGAPLLAEALWGCVGRSLFSQGRAIALHRRSHRLRDRRQDLSGPEQGSPRVVPGLLRWMDALHIPLAR